MNLNSIKMKEKFEKWMFQVGQKSGKKYKPNTITTYSRAIRTLFTAKRHASEYL